MRKERDRKIVENGRYIFREHETGDEAFIVEKGAVDILRMTDDGITILATIGPGEIFGEMALIDDRPRMASARASGLVSLMVISRTLFKSKLKRTDPFILGLLNILSAEMRRLGDEKMKSE